MSLCAHKANLERRREQDHSPAPSCRCCAWWGLRGIDRSIHISFPISLDFGDAQPGKPGAIDRAPSRTDFFIAQPVSVTGLIETEQPAIDRSQDLGLATADPIDRIGRRQIVDCQWPQMAHDRSRPGIIFEHRELSGRTAIAASCSPSEVCSKRFDKILQRRDLIASADDTNSCQLVLRLTSVNQKTSHRAVRRGKRWPLFPSLHPPNTRTEHLILVQKFGMRKLDWPNLRCMRDSIYYPIESRRRSRRTVSAAGGSSRADIVHLQRRHQAMEVC